MIPMQGPTILTCLNHYVRECPDTRALPSRNQGSLMRFGVRCPSISLHHHDLNAKKKVKVKHWATSILVMSEKFQNVVIL
jgi:hypothetical protein